MTNQIRAKNRESQRTGLITVGYKVVAESNNVTFDQRHDSKP